ncbi:MAG: response regulator, partial [Candidatus Aminicenantes bacterium]|nr:response regulator [Candidatus Aminicenantes bacterium]
MKNILILDDDPVILEIIKDELAKSGKYNILLASNGVEGLGVLESNSIDILITDLLMPEFDGIQLISYMKENQINIPVLVITSVDDTDVIDQIKNLGIADILKKPIDFNELEQKISFAIKNHGT